MTAGSLQALTPTLLIAGERDQQLPPETDVRPMLEHLRPPSGYREMASAQHYSFLLLCRPGASERLARTDEQILCQEAAGRTREQIHAEALELIATFLLDRGVLARRPWTASPPCLDPSMASATSPLPSAGRARS